ncbi:MAG: acyl-CoA desaturase [Polyangiaceae bacterium]|nr:acyl-CoA desaturase [Polyangiaceae bacterium]
MSDPAPARKYTYRWVTSIPFLLIHVVALVGAIWVGFSWQMLLLAVAFYYIRMFGVTAGYHRYFSHRTFRTSRVFQFLLALLAQSSAQKGALWWASHHRLHHKKSDLPGDVHSVKLDGFLWAHVGWILSTEFEDTDMNRVNDLAKYPELRWLNKHFLVPPTVLAVAMFLIGGAPALMWGFFVSTVLLWHGTFTINSLSHLFGKRRYQTTDESRNNWLLAIITMGEGWHNNHHHYQRSVNQGFYWWEFDLTYYILWAMSKVGLVWDLHTPPPHVLVDKRIDADARDSAPDVVAPLPLREAKEA